MDLAPTIIPETAASRNGRCPPTLALPAPELQGLAPTDPLMEPWAAARSCSCAHPLPLPDDWFGEVWIRCLLCGRDVAGVAR